MMLSMPANTQELSEDQLVTDLFHPPSIWKDELISGNSYTYHSEVPKVLSDGPSTPCVLGIDEAGRGPVLGPMVYGAFYVPEALNHPLLSETHNFDDSKVLSSAVRSSLMQSLCTAEADLHQSCGWATRVISARDIGAGMLMPCAVYNLNAQAMDATIQLIHELLARINIVTAIYIDTIGNPAVYQNKLERVFPAHNITVAKKADSLYPCVSAASVCAKVTRDAALEVIYTSYADQGRLQGPGNYGWGSGYPSDGRCISWLKENIDPIFGWGNECRFSWGTAKELLEKEDLAVEHDWLQSEQEDAARLDEYFTAGGIKLKAANVCNWYGRIVEENAL